MAMKGEGCCNLHLKEEVVICKYSDELSQSYFYATNAGGFSWRPKTSISHNNFGV